MQSANPPWENREEISIDSISLAVRNSLGGVAWSGCLSRIAARGACASRRTSLVLFRFALQSADFVCRVTGLVLAGEYIVQCVPLPNSEVTF